MSFLVISVKREKRRVKNFGVPLLRHDWNHAAHGGTVKSLAEFAARTPRSIEIIFLTTCASEKFFSASKCAQRARAVGRNPFGNEIVRFHARSSAIASSCALFSSVMAERMVTVLPSVTFLQPSSSFFISLAAAGAQEPFSMNATCRF